MKLNTFSTLIFIAFLSLYNFCNAKSITTPKLSLASEDQELVRIIDLSRQQKWLDADELARKSRQKDFALSIKTIMQINNNPSTLSLSEIKNFFLSHPWIPRNAFASKIEKSFTFELPHQEVIEWFNFSPAESNNAKFLLLHAKIRSNIDSLENPDTKFYLRELWKNTDFDAASEEFFIKKYKEHLTLDDLLKKIEFLTWNKSLNNAQRLINLLPEKHKSLPHTRLLVAKNPESVITSVAKLNSKVKEDEYIYYRLTHNMFDKNKDEIAFSQLSKLAKSYKYHHKWWKLKNMAIRNALKDKKYNEAYKLTLNHG